MAEVLKQKFLGKEGVEQLILNIRHEISSGDSTSLDEAKTYADGLADNYDSAGTAATAEANAKSYINSKVAEVNDVVAGVKTIAEQGVADAATADGKAIAAQAAADRAQSDVDTLELYVGTIPENYSEANIIAYINKKAQETLDSASGGSSESAASVLAALNTYKAENNPKVDKNIEDIAALTAALDEEAVRADAAEKVNAAAIKVISDDYLKGSDKNELQGNIDEVNAAVERLTNGASADEVDGVNDLIAYVKEHGTEVTGMREDIAENAEAISDFKSRITTLEDKFEGEGNVGTQIATAKQEAIDAAATDATSKSNTAESNAKEYADSLNSTMNARVDDINQRTINHINDINFSNGEPTLDMTVEGESVSRMNQGEADFGWIEYYMQGNINGEIEFSANTAIPIAPGNNMSFVSDGYRIFINADISEITSSEIEALFA